MDILERYEGAIYYFDKALQYITDELYDKAMEMITKGYKHLKDTPIIDKTKCNTYTESIVSAIQEERKVDAKDTIDKLKLTVEVWQKNNLMKNQNT